MSLVLRGQGGRFRHGLAHEDTGRLRPSRTEECRVKPRGVAVPLLDYNTGEKRAG